MRPGYLHTEQALEAAGALFKRTGGRVAHVLLVTNALTTTALAPRGFGIANLLAGICSTGGGILSVSRHPAWVDESYMLGRAYLERVVNSAFLATCEADAYDDFVANAIARRYREEDRAVTLGGKTIAIRKERLPGPLPPEIEGAVRRFTSKKGRPLNWTDRTLEQRADSVATSAGELDHTVLAIAILGIYGKASEALHGTLYGTSAFEEGPVSVDPGTGEYNWDERRASLVALFLMLARTTEWLLRVLAARAGAVAVTDARDAAQADVEAFFAASNEAPACPPC